MPTPILATKLYIPTPRPELVHRPRLVERMNAGLLRKLTLISAPAGFGKTTLLSEWIPRSPRCVTWLSLDEGDNDPTRFWSHFIASLQGLRSDLGSEALALLQSPQPPTIISILTALINEITRFPDVFASVLDDYHVIDARPIDQAFGFLIEHLPPNMHLVITSRDDPNLPLARLRARSQMNEFRLADLRFTIAEAAEFLNQVMGLSLPESDITALEARTEGWIAGLHLAAISMQGHTDTAGFIRSFTGSHHFVMDYLVEEVLQQQPELIQSFLLRTSILDRLCGPLCDAVLGEPDGSSQETLEYLEQRNLFIVPLDNERTWFRYHHLFADLLRKRLQQLTAQSGTDLLTGYHLRASKWYESSGLEIEAFKHAAAANDIERAARLMEGGGMPLQYRGAMAPVLNWLGSLPTATLDAKPSLWVAYASALTLTGKPVSQIEEILQAAENACKSAAPGEATRDLLGQIAAIRAMLAIPQNQVETMAAQSQLALEYLQPDNLSVRTNAAWTLGYAYQLMGNRAAAIQAYRETLAISQDSGNLMITLGANTCLGQVQESENQLFQAAESYQRVLQQAGDPPMPAACEAYLGLARLNYEWNELAAAEKHGQLSLRLARQLENVDTPAASMALLARLKLAGNDIAGAAALLKKAEQFLRKHLFAHRMPEIAAVQVLLLLRQGSPAQAAELAQRYHLSTSLAQVHLSNGDPSKAMALLEAQRQEAGARGLPDEQLKATVLQAVAHQLQGEKERAVQLLGEALALAEPGGFLRIFVDQGPPMAALLHKVCSRGGETHYVLRILEAFGKVDTRTPAAQPLVESLSERELEVLKLLSTYLKGPEIASQLMVSLNTLHTHTKNIYHKLGANSRQAAVRRAQELGLL